MNLKLFFAASMLATLVAAPALAQQAGMQMTPEQREARFTAGDTNKDGKLSKDEWLAILPEQAKPMADQMWSARVDADGDGFITKEQFLALRMGPRPGGN
jgi:Ca2+-binding EF-hand superfamily protein